MSGRPETCLGHLKKANSPHRFWTKVWEHTPFKKLSMAFFFEPLGYLTLPALFHDLQNPFANHPPKPVSPLFPANRSLDAPDAFPAWCGAQRAQPPYIGVRPAPLRSRLCSPGAGQRRDASFEGLGTPAASREFNARREDAESRGRGDVCSFWSSTWG